MPRRENDAYYTPAWQVRVLLAYQPDITLPGNRILEPCAGDGSIVKVIPARVLGNDTAYGMDNHDASGTELYEEVAWTDWVITNPPYTMPLCRDIVTNAVAHARVGVAMLLRLSFLEPTTKRNARGPWLAEHPPSQLIVLPRYSYTQDGKSDSCTTAWFVWRFNGDHEREPCDLPIVCVPDADRLYARDGD